ncbi:Spc7 kinetochore protein-domain-containing protein [Scleroderma citrinum]
MTVNMGPQSRRNSIAVTSQNKAHPGHRRRAHSIAPGDRPSPASKARRSIAPRKSILKAAANTTDDGDDRTQAMDMTSIVRFDVESTRKSLGRRVSFANHAHVRLFEVPEQNTNSTASPQSSPAAEVENHGVENDENAYPGAASFKRRSSIRRSIAFSEGGGEESMDMDSDNTGYSPAAFFRAGNEFEGGDDIHDFDDAEDYPDDDMDVTEAIPHNIIRKRSPSLGVPRQPLANLTSPQTSLDNQGEDVEEEPMEQSYVDEDSTQSQSLVSEDNASQPMEFTVPLVRPPKPPSNAWLALRAATHSGDTPYIPSSDDEEERGARDMELTDAVSRLEAARTSLGLGNNDGEEGQLDSFNSTEDSFAEENSVVSDEGNQTINVTQLMRRVSLAPSIDDSTMEVTTVYNAQADSNIAEPSIMPQPVSPTVAKPNSHIPTDTHSDSLPSGEPPNTTAAPKPFSFTPRPRTPASPGPPRSPSPSKAKGTIPSPKKFTAAFAPPVPKPSPGKRSTVAAGIPDGRSSPAKKVAGPMKLTAGFSQPNKPQSSTVSGRQSPSKPPLSQAQQPTQPGGGLARRPSLGLRRPSGYFSQRKSVGELNVTPNVGVNATQDSLEPRTEITDFPQDSLPTSSNPNVESLELRADTSDSFHDSLPLDSIQHTSSPMTPPPETSSEIIQDASAIREDTKAEPDSTSAEGTSLNSTEQWRDDVQQESAAEEEGPQISIEQFFEMTGIRFMDEIAAPRRSTVYPSALRPSRRTSNEAEIPLAEYVVAMALGVPQLELYTHVSKDLQAWIERIQGIFGEAEEEALKMTPQLFQEFVMTDETGQAELVHQLKLIKVHNHEQAKSEWYDWKMQWVEQLYQKASAGFEDLEKDAKFLEGIIHRIQDIVPSLQQEYDNLMEELQQEKADVAELEACDQDYLNELKGSIAEQSAELDTYRRDVEEAKGKLNRLQEKLEEVQIQKKDVSSAIEGTERLIHVQKNSTRAEVFRLKDELETVQNLHMLAITKVQPTLFEFVYASCYRVSVPCAQYRPLVGEIMIDKVPDARSKYKETFPALSSLMLRTAKELISQQEDLNIRQIVQYLGDYWCCCSQLQAQLKLVAIKYPVAIKETPSGFTANVTVLFPIVKSKAIVSFIFDTTLFSSWPVLIQSIQCDVKIAYGSLERETILGAVVSRMKDTSPLHNHACLLDACIEASECVQVA